MTSAPPRFRTRLSGWHQRFVVEERYVPAAERRALYVTAIVLVIVGLIGFTIVLLGVLGHTGFERLDQPVELWFNAQRAQDTTNFMIVLAIIFGPVALPIIVLVVLVIWTFTARHVWRPLLMAGGMLAGVILAQTIAPIVQHPRPPIGDMLFGPDRTFSFPSGHVLGTSDFFLLLAFLLASRIRRTWFTVAAISFAVIGIAAQVVSRLYLGYHWISDTTASNFLSLVIVGTVIAIDTHRTARVKGERVEGELSKTQTDGT